MTTALTVLAYQGQALEAAELYTSLVENSRITATTSLPDAPTGEHVRIVEFELAGTPYSAFDGGPGEHTMAASIMVQLPDQAAVDRLWDGLLDAGGEAVACGWITDPYGISWQVVPEKLMELYRSDDRAGVERAYAAMQDMVKLDLPKLEAAFRGE